VRLLRRGRQVCLPGGREARSQWPQHLSSHLRPLLPRASARCPRTEPSSTAGWDDVADLSRRGFPGRNETTRRTPRGDRVVARDGCRTRERTTSSCVEFPAGRAARRDVVRAGHRAALAATPLERCAAAAATTALHDAVGSGHWRRIPRCGVGTGCELLSTEWPWHGRRQECASPQEPDACVDAVLPLVRPRCRRRGCTTNEGPANYGDCVTHDVAMYLCRDGPFLPHTPS